MNNNTNAYNDKNDRIVDWILQENNEPGTCRQLSSDLLDYLFDQNVNTASFVQQQAQAQPQSQSSTPQGKAPQTKSSIPQELSQTQPNRNSSPSEEDDDPTDAQLKMMPSKERRQLRNKISARNFRNRRKEYMASLEAQMEQCKAENSQLKLEVKWVRGMMDKLQAENDRLRLELVLCKQSIQQQASSSDTLEILNAGNPAMDNYAYSNRSNISVSPPTNNLPMLPNSNFLPSIPNVTSSSNWNLNYPLKATCTNTNTSITSTTNTNTTSATPNSASLPSSCNNIYLAHASVPDWDISNILTKNSETITPSQKIDLIRAYPLLAPALMSIVLNQTVTMTTEEILSNSNLFDSTQLSPLTGDITANKLLLNSDSVNWEESQQQEEEEQEEQQQLQQRLAQSVVVSDCAAASQDSSTKRADHAQSKKDNCPINWVQKQFCMFVIHHVVAKYPRLEPKARKYLPICDKYRNKTSISQIA